MLKNAFPLYGKVVSILKNLKISHCMKKEFLFIQKFVKRTEKIIFSLVFLCFRFAEISYFLNYPSNENIRKQHLSASSYSCESILSSKAKHLHKIFRQIKQSYTKNELHSTKENSKAYMGCLQGSMTLNFIFIASLWHSLVFNSLVSNNCSIYA